MSASFPKIFQALAFEVLVLNLKKICLLQVIDFLVFETDVLGDYLVFEGMFVLIAKDALLTILLSLSSFVANT